MAINPPVEGMLSGPEIHVAGKASVIFVGTVTRLTEDADSVGVVDHQQAPEVAFDLDEVGQRADIAVHGEHAVGYDQCAVAASGPEFVAQGIEIVVAIAL
jgi:hypothetical protein